MTCVAIYVGEYSTRGARLRALREERGMSREQLAPMIGVRGQSIYRYENDSMEIGAETLLAAADVFGTDARWIMRGDPEDAHVIEAFREFEKSIAPTISPALSLAERGKLIWIRHHNPRPEKYLSDLIREREGESDSDRAASDAATGEAKKKGEKWGVVRKLTRHRP